MPKSAEAYITGLIFSVLLTLAAYFIVTGHLFEHDLMWILAGLALLQLWIQLAFFLHLNQPSQRWNLGIFISTVGTIFILVAGCLWIMNNLKYHMAPIHTDEQIFQGEAIQK